MAAQFEERVEVMRRERERQDEQLASLQAALKRIPGQEIRLPLRVVSALEERVRRAEQVAAAATIPTSALRA
jgi:hypothetical protein